MECQVISVPQGSDDWDALRRCRITVSRLGDVMADPKTKRYRKYRAQLACEMNGMEFKDEDKPWFAHGKEMEPRALAAYQWKFEQRIEHDLFFIHHKYDWLGGSPDFLTVDHSEGGEIKCRKEWEQYRNVVRKSMERERKGMSAALPEHQHQIQGAMWLTGFRSWWYVNYYENRKGVRKIHRILVARDDKLIREMERRCKRFILEVRVLAGETA